MTTFFDRFRSSITGVLSGFDRLVLRGHLRSLTYPGGMLSFLSAKSILLKDFLPWAKGCTDRVKADFTAQTTRAGQPVEYLRSASMEKEPLARLRQKERGITSGLVAAFSCVEPCRTWDVHKNREAKRLVPDYGPGQCTHLYRYIDHPCFGFMHVRLQTWFPFTIQVCMNGREYLRRALEQTNLGFAMRDNCFPAISNWNKAQSMFDRMLDLDWISVLDRFAQGVFPSRRQAVGDLGYQWSVYQSEWATDHAFTATASLDAIYPTLVRHALITSDTATVLRFLGRPVTASGTAHGKLKQEVTTRLVRRHEGLCVKHHVGRNSAKTYNKQGSVYRTEVTINCPSAFKVYRCAQGGDHSKDWRPLRASVVDLKRRAVVSQQINTRVLNHMAAVSTERPLGNIISGLDKPTLWHGERLRGLDLLGKDRLLIDILADPVGAINGIRNKNLCERLRNDPRGNGKTDRQLSGMSTRMLRLLRAHGLIKKTPRSHRYQLTDQGLLVVSSVKSALAASADQLMKLVA